MSDLDAVADKELLRRHATGGDKEAFGELFRRHRDRLWAVALRTMADPDEAADALQDAMVNAYRAAARFRGDSAVTTWLHRIIVNACLDRMRRRSARPATPMSDTMPENPAPAGDRATVLAVRDALGQLPDDQRAVVVYIDMLGYPVADVAKILAVPPGTIKSRASRARRALAELLPDEGNQAASDGVESVTTPQQQAAGTPPRLGKEERP